MAKYTKKSIVVDASRWFQNGDHPEDEYTRGTVDEGKIVRRYRNPDMVGMNRCDICGYFYHDHGWLDTLEGGFTVCPGDWIITGIKGEMYPCKSDIFNLTYDKEG